MGQRLELFTDKETAAAVVNISESFGIAAQVSGYVEKAERKEVIIDSNYGNFTYC